MEIGSLQKENIIKDIRNIFSLKKEQNYPINKDIRNPFRQEKKLKQLKKEYLEILRIFLSMKKKIVISQ